MKVLYLEDRSYIDGAVAPRVKRLSGLDRLEHSSARSLEEARDIILRGGIDYIVAFGPEYKTGEPIPEGGISSPRGSVKSFARESKLPLILVTSDKGERVTGLDQIAYFKRPKSPGPKVEDKKAEAIAKALTKSLPK